MVTSVVRKFCICRTSVVLKTLQNYCSILNPVPRLFNDFIFNPRSTGIVSFNTDKLQSGMDIVLKKHSTSVFRKPHENKNRKFPWNTATHITCYPNFDHIMFIHHCENSKEKPSGWLMLEKLNYMYHIMFATTIALIVTALWSNSPLQFLLPCEMKQEIKKIRGSADKSLARPTSRCRRMESIVSLDRGVHSRAKLKALPCYRGWKEAW